MSHIIPDATLYLPILRGSFDRDSTVAETGFRQATLETAINDVIEGHFGGDIIGFWELRPAAGAMTDGTSEVLEAAGAYSLRHEVQPSESSRYLLDQYGIEYWLDPHEITKVAEGKRIADREHWAEVRAMTIGGEA